MLLPALSKARAKARAITCVNNLKQSALYMRMYVDDWGAYPCPASNGVYCGWVYYLGIDGYYPVDNQDFSVTNIFRCPVVSVTRSLSGWDIWMLTRHQIYAMNTWLTGTWSRDAEGGAGFASDSTAGTKKTYFCPGTGPSSTILLYDSQYGTFGGGMQYSHDASDNYVTLRHNGRANAAFLDGHVESGNSPQFGNTWFVNGVRNAAGTVTTYSH